MTNEIRGGFLYLKVVDESNVKTFSQSIQNVQSS